MSNQQRRKADSTAPTLAIETHAATFPGAPANDRAPAPQDGSGTRHWMRSPTPDGFGAAGTLSGVPSEKISRLLRAAESRNTRSVIAAVMDLYDGRFELCLSAAEVEGCLTWTFRGDRCPDVELQAAA